MRRKLLSSCSNVDVFFLSLIAVGTVGGVCVTIYGTYMIMKSYGF